MPQFRFTNSQELVYVDRALVVRPGDVVEWDQPPADGNWQPADPPKTSKNTTTTAADAAGTKE